jgi:hypothetical protein
MVNIGPNAIRTPSYPFQFFSWYHTLDTMRKEEYHYLPSWWQLISLRVNQRHD